jgi:hypothetical protein
VIDSLRNRFYVQLAENKERMRVNILQRFQEGRTLIKLDEDQSEVNMITVPSTQIKRQDKVNIIAF